MRTITYRDEVFVDGKAKGITLGKLDSITTLFSNGGTDEDAKRLLNATDEEILAAKNRNLQVLFASN